MRPVFVNERPSLYWNSGEELQSVGCLLVSCIQCHLAVLFHSFTKFVSTVHNATWCNKFDLSLFYSLCMLSLISFLTQSHFYGFWSEEFHPNPIIVS